MSQRRSNRSTAPEELDSRFDDSIKECVRFLVCREGSKVPIKRAEIVKHLGNVCQTSANHVNMCIIQADKFLKKVYGYKLVQVSSKSGIPYILVLNEECESLPATVTNLHHRKLLVAALMHIYMSGGPVKEDEMWKFLSEAGLLDEEDHGGRKVLTSTLTRQMYLQYSKVGEGDLAKNVFEWGQRAIEEVPKIFLLNKMAERRSSVFTLGSRVFMSSSRGVDVASSLWTKQLDSHVHSRACRRLRKAQSIGVNSTRKPLK